MDEKAMIQNINKYLKEFIRSNHCTLLGVGVMSKNVVDVAIEISHNYDIPIMLIASRRQIEAEKFGGGYVNNWTTETFAKYVKENDNSHNIILARDHGGLWQNNFEKGYTFEEVEKSAKESFKVDIESEFDMIHIDTSINSTNNEESVGRLCELYRYCDELSPENVMFEIGSEEQSGYIQNTEDLKYTIHTIDDMCFDNDCRYPSFIVAQVGTKVLETQNIGNFENNYKNIKNIIEICNNNHVMLKQHNTDYLSDSSLRCLPRLGIHAANVAPEFAVVETLALIKILREYKLDNIVDEFIKLSYDSGRWKKWMMLNSTTTYEKKAIISGHYVFSDPKFLELKEFAEMELQRYNIDLDLQLKIAIRMSILRYLRCFNII